MKLSEINLVLPVHIPTPEEKEQDCVYCPNCESPPIGVTLTSEQGRITICQCDDCGFTFVVMED